MVAPDADCWVQRAAVIEKRSELFVAHCRKTSQKRGDQLASEGMIRVLGVFGRTSELIKVPHHVPSSRDSRESCEEGSLFLSHIEPIEAVKECQTIALLDKNGLPRS